MCEVCVHVFECVCACWSESACVYMCAFDWVCARVSSACCVLAGVCACHGVRVCRVHSRMCVRVCVHMRACVCVCAYV